jgi:hypothetical protein
VRRLWPGSAFRAFGKFRPCLSGPFFGFDSYFFDAVQVLLEAVRGTRPVKTHHAGDRRFAIAAAPGDFIATFFDFAPFVNRATPDTLKRYIVEHETPRCRCARRFAVSRKIHDQRDGSLQDGYG